MRRAHRALYRGEEFVGAVRARSHHVEDFRGRAVLLRAAGLEPGRGGRPCRQRLCQGRAAAAADGVRGRGAEADFDLAGRIGWLTANAVIASAAKQSRTKKTGLLRRKSSSQ